MSPRTQWRRLRGTTLEQRVYRLLRRHPAGMSPRDVAAEMEILRIAASQALRRLQRKGSAVGIGNTGGRRYLATDVQPDDWRGLTEPSLRNLTPRARKPGREAEKQPRRYRSSCPLADVWR